ncbi:ribonuclease H-like domain-containing protein [Mycena galopus ATCC 62051]|nr:ribonuclease H-like domain-containing protein [Mycena galopus ATCC 62051]
MSRSFRLCLGFEARGEDTTTHFYDFCDYDWRFYARCCHNDPPDSVCHDHPLVFVDGSCPQNGKLDARAGIGCAIGKSEEDQVSIAVTDAMDSRLPRTSQRAELLAALYGLDMLIDTAVNDHSASRAPECAHLAREYVVVADSEYVVKGITEWVPEWKRNNWKNRQGDIPKNLDLFQRLDNNVSYYERQGFKIQFFHVRRELNTLADELAKRATAIPTAAF